MLSQEITESPTANHLQCCFFFVLFFVFGCQIKQKFVQKLVCESINTFSCHSECTKENTLIQAPNVDSQRSLTRIATDEKLRYIVLFKTVPAISFDQINVPLPINRSQRLYCLAVMNTRYFVM